MSESADLDPAALERELLGGERRFTRLQVAELSGVAIERCNELWNALGFADVADDVKAFTDRDVWALQTVDKLGSEGWLPDELQVSMARALGQSLSRLADWQLAAIGSMLDPALAQEQAMRRAQELVPVVEDLIGYVWRRHLAAVAGRVLASSGEEFASGTLAVGFADLVGFTSLTREIGDAELGALVERFEGRASDVVATGGGRVIKTIGDEVLFVADDVRTAAEIGMRLSEEVPDDSMPDLRVGLAFGTVLSRLGDVYGEPVNLASRLTSMARPGSVLVDREFAQALDGTDGWQLRRVPPRPARGYTMLYPLRLRRSS
ncbi:MAG TPA: adenylate/guanylate cyclase domain-containing protein [Mycobacteriales bacterium]|nr:adenylate/guanylate cyclase domain-containing protein [Mycobacteriales bacterium]